MRSRAFAPPLYLSVFAAFVRRQVIPPDCKMLWRQRRTRDPPQAMHQDIFTLPFRFNRQPS
ncbi:hypothetical protein GHJ82_08855 [Sinorhizobium saheli]|nr:hypothetical protein [Sinorhizobium saheli]